MPTYVYACDTCQVQFEKFQSFNDEPLRTCPTCQNSVRRVLQPAGIVFKGSGWHITDYRAQQGSSATSAASTAGDSTPAAPAGESTAAAAPESSTPAPAAPAASDSTAS